MAVRRRFWSSLRVQVILLMIIVLMLPLGGVGWYYYKTLSSDLGEIERAHALEVSDSAHRLVAQLGEQLSGSVIKQGRGAWKRIRGRRRRSQEACAAGGPDRIGYRRRNRGGASRYRIGRT